MWYTACVDGARFIFSVRQHGMKLDMSAMGYGPAKKKCYFLGVGVRKLCSFTEWKGKYDD